MSFMQTLEKGSISPTAQYEKSLFHTPYIQCNLITCSTMPPLLEMVENIQIRAVSAP